MKKWIFYTAVLLTLVLSIHIIKIVTTEFDRLTEYGFGYLTGKIILLAIFLSLMYATRGDLLKKETKL